jgi:hypothetical protein
MAAEGIYFNRYCPITLLIIALSTVCCYSLQDSTAINGSNAQVLHSILTGDNVHIGFVASGNVKKSHKAFLESHVDNNDINHIGFSYNFHDTPFAGIIISRGDVNHPNDIGVAPDSFIDCIRVNSSDIGQYEDALNQLITVKNCKVIVTGLQFNYDPNNAGYYQDYIPDGNSNYTKLYDYNAYINENVVFANAAGNYVTDTSNPPKILFRNITIFGDAYNSITTGGLSELPTNNYCVTGSASSKGCTLDGRRKPDISAPSSFQIAPGYSSSSDYFWNTGYYDGATSWAVPHTAGVAALLVEYANSTSTEPDDNKNIVIKAVIVNSAFPNIRDKSGAYTDPANRVWDPNRGYGRIDALKAYQTLSAPKILKNVSVTAMKGWAYDSLNGNGSNSYFIHANKDERLVLTVSWNRKITKKVSLFSSSYEEESTPKFNIYLSVKEPNEAVLYSETDVLNNLKKIDLQIPVSGEYEIILNNTTNRTRSYALAFERLEPLTADFNRDFIVNSKDLGQLAFDWLSTGWGHETDLVPDANVNNRDFGVFAENWMRKDGRYYHP